MNEPWPISPAWTGGFVLTILWQSTLWLTVGLLASRLLRRHAARAHLVLVLAMAAALISPVLTATVRQLQWGVLSASESTMAPAAPGSEVVASLREPFAAESSTHDLGALQADQKHGPKLDPITRPHELSHAPEPPPKPTQAVPAADAGLWFPISREGLPFTIGAAWIVCSLAISLRLVAILLAGRRVVRNASVESHPKLLEALNQAAGALALRSEPVLRTSPAARCPMIWCWGRHPILVTPRSAAVQDGVSWLGVFCHELAHWLRRDHWSWLFAEVLVVVIPWHPLAWRTRRSLSYLREQACDDWVLAAGAEAIDYAESLVNLVPQGSQAYALAAVRSRESLKRRLEHVLAGVRVAPTIGRRWIAAAAISALAAAAGVAFAQQRTPTIAEKTTTSTISEVGPAGEIKVLPAKEEHGDVARVRGRVLKPNGDPAGGANVSVFRFNWSSGDKVRWDFLATGRVSAAGHFEVAFQTTGPSDGTSLNRLQWFVVLAQANGFGLQWTWYRDIEPSKPLVLNLVADVPIHGRVVDLEGKPIGGVGVKVRTIHDAKTGNLTPWLQAMKTGVQRWDPAANALLGKFLKGFPAASPVDMSTDADGRFTLTGIGAERVVELGLHGERSAYKQLMLATRSMEPIIRGPKGNIGDGGLELFGANFTFAAQPTRPIVGTVRDAATRKSIVGVSVESLRFAGTKFGGMRDLRTETDAEGRFRLIGMPKGKGNTIFIVPNDDQPYFMRRIDVPETTGIEPVTVDIELHRGLWITGRVTDKVTGKPVFSNINYWPFLTNPFPKRLPEFDRGGNMDGDYVRYSTRVDGTYRLPGLPGRGIVGALAMEGRYRNGAGAEEIKGLDEDGRFKTYRNEMSPSLKWPTAVKEIDPAQGTELVPCDFALERGETLRITVVDPDGKPVSGCWISEAPSRGSNENVNASFELTALDPRRVQSLLIRHKERNLGKFIKLAPAANPAPDLKVTLLPCATLVGRLVDEDGLPFKGIALNARTLPNEDFSPGLPPIICHSDGTFEYPGLAAGCDYDVRPQGAEIKSGQRVAKKLAIEPGKRIDLGTIKLDRQK